MTRMQQRDFVKKTLGEIEDRIVRDINVDQRDRTKQELLGEIIYEATTFETDEQESEVR